MGESIVSLGEADYACGYFPERTSRTEQFFAFSYSPGELEGWLENGYRHFGYYFFRPVCGDCHRCIPLRVPLDTWVPTASARRLAAANRHLTVSFAGIGPSRESFALYAKHKERFKDKDPGSFDTYAESFFTNTPGSGMLTIHDGARLAAVSHFDAAGTVLSAVYCYYDAAGGFAGGGTSLGTWAVYLLLEAAKRQGFRYAYLGYFIEENRHMRYKKRFYPNELLVTEGRWEPFTDSRNACVNPDAAAGGFVPASRMHRRAPAGQGGLHGA